MRPALVLVLAALPCAAGAVTGVVLDERGNPLAGADVQLAIGKAHYRLTEEFDRWESVEVRTGKSGADGRFAFADVPDNAVATASVRTAEGIGVATGAGQLEVRLGPFAALKGKVTGKRSDLKELRLVVLEGDGFGWQDTTVDKKTGKYELSGLAPGAGRVLVRRGNFDVARVDVELVAGKVATVPQAKAKDSFLPSADPLVEVLTARLVDKSGDPVAGVQLVWSSQWMDGGMNSDADGVVKLAGGGVAIGGPPYRLRVQSLRGGRGVFEGVLTGVKRSVAVVELRPLREVRGTVRRGEGAVPCRLFVVAGDRVYAAEGTDGTYTVHVPPGPCRLVVGTVDGRLHESTLEVKEGDTALDHDVPLGD